jgi:hypothetical protein
VQRSLAARVGGDLLGRGRFGALELGAARRQGAQREARLVGNALELAQLLARVAERLLGAALRLLELGVPFLAAPSRTSSSSKRCSSAALRRPSSASCSSIAANSDASCSRRTPVCSACCDNRSSSTCSWCARDCASAASRARPRCAATHRCRPPRRAPCAARLVGDHRLRAHLAVEVLDLLGARQQAGLLAIGRIEADRVLADRVALARHDDLAVRQVRARGERRIEIGRGVDALEPVVQQRLEARIAEPQQVAEARQSAVGVRDRAGRRRVEREPHRRRIGGERLHRLEPADLQRADALAQRRFERRLPAVLDVQAGPQALQRIEAVRASHGFSLPSTCTFSCSARCAAAARRARHAGPSRH